MIESSYLLLVLQEMKYEFEAEMEGMYRTSLLKSFKKQIDNLYFNFIIVDSCNEKVQYFEEFWSYAKSKGFQVYVVDLQSDPAVCHKRNTHGRTLDEINKVSMCNVSELYFSTCNSQVLSGFPTPWKIMENLENEKCVFQTWKNHGI